MGKIGKRTRVCLACGKRIRNDHPYVGIEDAATGSELLYHARPECQIAGAEQFDAMMRRGGLYLVHHYHICGDEAPGPDCSGGCFAGKLVMGVN